MYIPKQDKKLATNQEEYQQPTILPTDPFNGGYNTSSLYDSYQTTMYPSTYPQQTDGLYNQYNGGFNFTQQSGRFKNKSLVINRSEKKHNKTSNIQNNNEYLDQSGSNEMMGPYGSYNEFISHDYFGHGGMHGFGQNPFENMHHNNEIPSYNYHTGIMENYSEMSGQNYREMPGQNYREMPGQKFNDMPRQNYREMPGQNNNIPQHNENVQNLEHSNINALYKLPEEPRHPGRINSQKQEKSRYSNIDGPINKFTKSRHNINTQQYDNRQEQSVYPLSKESNTFTKSWHHSVNTSKIQKFQKFKNSKKIDKNSTFEPCEKIANQDSPLSESSKTSSRVDIHSDKHVPVDEKGQILSLSSSANNIGQIPPSNVGHIPSSNIGQTSPGNKEGISPSRKEGTSPRDNKSPQSRKRKGDYEIVENPSCQTDDIVDICNCHFRYELPLRYQLEKQLLGPSHLIPLTPEDEELEPSTMRSVKIAQDTLNFYKECEPKFGRGSDRVLQIAFEKIDAIFNENPSLTQNTTDWEPMKKPKFIDEEGINEFRNGLFKYTKGMSVEDLLKICHDENDNIVDLEKSNEDIGHQTNDSSLNVDNEIRDDIGNKDRIDSRNESPKNIQNIDNSNAIGDVKNTDIKSTVKNTEQNTSIQLLNDILKDEKHIDKFIKIQKFISRQSSLPIEKSSENEAFIKYINKHPYEKLTKDMI